MKTLRATVHGGFPILFGEDARELLLERIEEAAPDKVFVVADRTIEALHVETVRDCVPHKFDVESVVFNEGEGNKNLATLEHVAGDLLRAGATADSLVLNVGGGVTLNLGGLAASLVGHGARFAQIPTSFAAQWSVVNTNRQAINFIGGRNFLGLYRSPLFAVVDPFFLETEEERPILASLVDYARQALILGGATYDRALATLSAKDFHRPPALAATLEACLDHALALGEADPAERDRAAMESYGYAVARALEALADGRLLHGEAVYFGMRVSSAAAGALGVMPPAEIARHEALLDRLGLAVPFPAHVRTDQLIYKLHGNNKTQADGLVLPMMEAIGRMAASPPRLTDVELGAAIDKVRSHA